MVLNLVRSAITNALKTKLKRTYGSFLQEGFGHASMGILTTDFVTPKVLTTNFSKISLRHKSASKRQVNVKHDQKKNIFYIDEPGCKAKLQYEMNKTTVYILATIVPKSCGGRGYGKLLAEEALLWIAKNDYRVVIECDFVEEYVRNNKSKFQKYIK